MDSELGGGGGSGVGVQRCGSGGSGQCWLGGVLRRKGKCSVYLRRPHRGITRRRLLIGGGSGRSVWGGEVDGGCHNCICLRERGMRWGWEELQGGEGRDGKEGWRAHDGRDRERDGVIELPHGRKEVGW